MSRSGGKYTRKDSKPAAMARCGAACVVVKPLNIYKNKRFEVVMGGLCAIQEVFVRPPRMLRTLHEEGYCPKDSEGTNIRALVDDRIEGRNRPSVYQSSFIATNNDEADR